MPNAPDTISFVPDPVAWTEVPDSLRVLTRQRDRWQRGLLQSLSRHRRMLFNPRYGRIGMIAFPYFWFMEGLGPVVEFFGYVAFALAILLGWAAPWFVLAFLLLAVFSGVALSLAAVALEELSFRRYHTRRDFALLMACAVLENFGYRQILTFARFRGVVMAVLGRMSWGTMEKQGVLQQPTTRASSGRSSAGGRVQRESAKGRTPDLGVAKKPGLSRVVG